MKTPILVLKSDRTNQWTDPFQNAYFKLPVYTMHSHSVNTMNIRLYGSFFYYIIKVLYSINSIFLRQGEKSSYRKILKSFWFCVSEIVFIGKILKIYEIFSVLIWFYEEKKTHPRVIVHTNTTFADKSNNMICFIFITYFFYSYHSH